jgi:EmrB/QacA subfamily drug resistance transporter
MPSTNRMLTVVGLVASLGMGALEATVVSTAMPTVIGELHGIEHYAWVTTAYLLASTVVVPIVGKLADIYGRKPLILFGIALFLAGSTASGVCQSMTQLILFRALQGLGAGVMQPMALTIVGDIFDLEERARMQGVFGAVWGVSGLIGPLLGGFIVKYLSWRWVFYINLPFGLLAAALISTQLWESVEKKPRKLDVLGAITCSAAVVALLLAAEGRLPRLPLSIAAIALVAAFLWIERRAEEPMLPLALFRRPVMAISSLAGAIIGGAMIATLTFVPLFVRGVMHGDELAAGWAITPMVIGWPIASALGGRALPKIGFRPLVRAGLGLTALGGIALWFFSREPSIWAFRGTTALFGVGMGLANTALLIAVQTSVSWEQRGIATASTMFFRTIGGTLAVGVMGGVLRAALLSDPTISSDAASQMLAPGRHELPAELLGRLAGVLADGLVTVFAIIAGMSAVAFLVGLAFPYIDTKAAAKPTPAPAPG